MNEEYYMNAHKHPRVAVVLTEKEKKTQPALGQRLFFSLSQ